MNTATWETLQEQATGSFDVPLAGGDGVLFEGQGSFSGWSVRETTGAAAASFELYDGGGVNGQLLATAVIASGTSDNHNGPAGGVEVESGLFLHVVSGTLKGVVYAKIRGG